MLNKKKSENKKILAFMNSYSSGKSGGDVIFSELVPYFSKYSEVTIVTSELGRKTILEYCKDVNFIITDKRKYFKNIIITYFFRGLKALSLFAKLNNTDILYGTSDFLPDVFPIFFYKLFSRKIVWIQCMFLVINKDHIISHYAQKMSFFLMKILCDKTIVLNNEDKDYLIEIGFNEKRVEVVYPPINLKNIQNVKCKNDIYNYDAVFFARLTKYKGVYDLIEIWDLVVKSINNATLAIIGAGDITIINKIKDMIKIKKLEANVRLLGFIGNDDERFSIVKSSKILAYPSHEESFCLSIAESIALGTPVVAYDLPVYQQIYGNSITYAKLLDINDFSNKIIKLLNDESLLTYHSKLGLEVVKKYNIENCAKKEMLIMSI